MLIQWNILGAVVNCFRIVLKLFTTVKMIINTINLYRVKCLNKLIYLYFLNYTFFLFLDRRQRGPIRSVLLVIIGWLVGWLVGNTVFSEAALRTFLIFCMKLGDYEGRKVTEPDFWKKFLIWRYSRKSLQISPKSDTLIFFSKTAITIFFCFWPEVSTKYDLQFE